ncbi:MAG: DUF2891 domain-containing protein, partial [Lysobacterales bacterium]
MKHSNFARALLLCVALAAALPAAPARAADALDGELAVRFARLALDCVHREYPNKIAHVLNSAADSRPPASLHPAFYGCFDWHSAVHGHWMLVRLLHVMPEGSLPVELREEIAAALDQSFTPEAIAGEIEYFNTEGREDFERPYGLAWFLQLTAELREWNDLKAKAWLQTLLPLEKVIVQRIETWLPKLAYPIRLGTHNQSMFAFGLMLDWARTAGDQQLAGLLIERSLAFHRGDRNCPLAYEPSGEDFLSPCLMEADLMRRILPHEEFASWLEGFLPQIPRDGSADWLAVGIVNDPSDGKLVHLDGLNLSRAWNLRNIAEALPANDKRRASLLAAARVHETEGLA